MELKFRKVRNEKRWIAQNGTTIQWNVFFNHYQINKKTMFAFADTLEEAKKIAKNDFRFNS